MTASRVTARLGGSEAVFACNAGQVVLDAALEVGVALPFSCREGHCGTCMAVLVSGTVDNLPSTVLSRRDRSKGFVLACRARPTSPDVYLSFDD